MCVCVDLFYTTTYFCDLRSLMRNETIAPHLLFGWLLFALFLGLSHPRTMNHSLGDNERLDWINRLIARREAAPGDSEALLKHLIAHRDQIVIHELKKARKADEALPEADEAREAETHRLAIREAKAHRLHEAIVALARQRRRDSVAFFNRKPPVAALDELTIPIEQPNVNDVLCTADGVEANEHEGNKRFLKVITSNKEKHQRASEENKQRLTRQVVLWVHTGNTKSRNPAPRIGRFLLKNSIDDWWYEMNDDAAIVLVSRMLSDEGSSTYADGTSGMDGALLNPRNSAFQSVSPGSSTPHPSPSASPPLILELRALDIVYGRGPLNYGCQGNQEHRIHLTGYYDRYVQATSRQKRSVRQEVIEAWRRRGGRYLISIHSGGRRVFQELDDESVDKKVRDHLVELGRHSTRTQAASDNAPQHIPPRDQQQPRWQGQQDPSQQFVEGQFVSLFQEVERLVNFACTESGQHLRQSVVHWLSNMVSFVNTTVFDPAATGPVDHQQDFGHAMEDESSGSGENFPVNIWSPEPAFAEAPPPDQSDLGSDDVSHDDVGLSTGAHAQVENSDIEIDEILYEFIMGETLSPALE
jgi:hypothetical protein